MRVKGQALRRISAMLAAMTLVMAFFVRADAAGRTYDKNRHTAFITEKDAWWEEPDEFLARLLLSVNGTQILEPLDVVICLDRSGSMDMEFIIPAYGDHSASCPCLNQNHFYLKPIGFFEHVNPDLYTQRYDDLYDGNGDVVDPDLQITDGDKLIVYNAQYNKWIALGASNPINLYYEFPLFADSKGNPQRDGLYHDDYDLAPYHFTKDSNGNFVRISKWDTNDIRKKGLNKISIGNSGLWDHADSSEYCIDRWTEAKDAVVQFSDQLLRRNEKNSVALIPFSVRDSAMQAYVNSVGDTKQWLIDQGLWDDAWGTDYTAQVSWTQQIQPISSSLDGLFTTGNTDYVYALSMAYNMLQARSPQAKQEKRAVVVFLSDGKPYNMDGTVKYSGQIGSFFNAGNHINHLAGAIKEEAGVDYTGELTFTEKYAETGSVFWTHGPGTGGLQRHDVNPAYLTNGNTAASGLGAQIVTVGYMLDQQGHKDRLAAMASDSSLYIDIPASSSDKSSNRLADALLSATLFPGGRNAVLNDVVSKYFYVPDDYADNVEKSDSAIHTSVTVTPGTGPDCGTQTIVWSIGDIYKYDTADEPTITVPLVLREEYRDVKRDTYYPTNDDKPEPSLYDKIPGPDGPNNGAQLDYDDPSDEHHYHTIGTPKLPVPPKGTTGPTEPTDPEPTKPTDPEPTKPTDPEPTKPTDPEPTKPTDPEPTKPTDPEPTRPTNPQPTSPTSSTTPTSSTEPVTSPTVPPTRPTAPVRPARPDNPNSTPDYEPLGDLPVPLASLPSLTQIFDDGIPLASLPKTGAAKSSLVVAGVLALLAGLILRPKRED